LPFRLSSGKGPCFSSHVKEHRGTFSSPAAHHSTLQTQDQMASSDAYIVGAVSFSQNIYDGHTLPEALKQTEELVGRRAKVAICDRGYRGKCVIEGTRIEIPRKPRKRASAYEKRKARKPFRRRAGIEPVIGHLKSDFRLLRNYLKGSVGDSINLMLAAAAYNFKKLMRQILDFLFLFFRTMEVQVGGSIPIRTAP